MITYQKHTTCWRLGVFVGLIGTVAVLVLPQPVRAAPDLITEFLAGSTLDGGQIEEGKDVKFFTDVRNLGGEESGSPYSWEIVGTPLPIPTPLGLVGVALAPLRGGDGVAFFDTTAVKTLRYYYWNGSTWSLSGLTMSVPGAGAPALTALNYGDVVFFDSGNDMLRTYRRTGAAWEQVGSALTIPGTGVTALAALNGTHVAFFDRDQKTLRTYRWDGTEWFQTGSGLTIPGAGFPALAALNETDVAYFDSDLEDLRTYRWSGSSWSQIGSGFSLYAAASPALTAINDTDVVLYEDGFGTIRTYRWDGATWSQISAVTDTGVSGAGALATLDGTNIAYFDAGAKELRTYHFAGEPSMTRFCIDGTAADCESAVSPIILTDQQTGPLAAAGDFKDAETESEIWTVPYNFAGGHMLWTCADAENNVNESDEANNCSAVPFMVFPRLVPDIVSENLIDDKSGMIEDGQTVNFSGDVRNQGGAWTGVSMEESFDTLPNSTAYSFVFDSANGVFYLGTGNGGVIYRCNISTECDEPIDWTESADLVAWRVYSLVYVNGVIYAGTDPVSRIYRCDTSTGCDETADWTESKGREDDGGINSITVDTVNNVLYAGSWSSDLRGAIRRCNLATNCDATGDWTISYQTPHDSVDDILFDPATNALYASAGRPGLYSTFYRCNTTTGCDAKSDWSEVLSTTEFFIREIGADSVNDVLYFGTSEYDTGSIYRCDTASGCETEGDWSIVYDTSESYIASFGLNLAEGTLYASTGSTGEVHFCRTSSGCDAPGDWSLLYDFVSQVIEDLSFDPVHNTMFLARKVGGSAKIYRMSEIPFKTRFCLDGTEADCQSGTSPTVLTPDPETGPLDASGGASDTETETATWTATVGSYTLWMCADVGNDVSESDETNNCASMPFTVASPGFADLTADRPAAVGGAEEGDSITFSGVVRNDSSNAEADADGTWNNRFQIDVGNSGSYNDPEDVMLDSPMTDLALGSTKTATSPSWTATLGDHRVRLCADMNPPPDPDGNIDEDAYEGNNCSIQWRNFTVSPNFPNSSIDVTPFSTIQGDPYTVEWDSDTGDPGLSCTVTKQYESDPPTVFSTAPSGSATENSIPVGTYTYRIDCSNTYQSDFDQETHEVDVKPPDFSATPDTINEGDPVTIDWTCYFSGPAYGGVFPYSQGTNFSTGGAESGSAVLNPGPSNTTTYQLNCDNGGFAQDTVTVRVPTVDITAEPKLLPKAGGTSEVSWSASGVNSCTVTGPSGTIDSAGAPLPDGTWTGTHTTPPLDSETIYRITCETAVNTYTDAVSINIVPVFEER